MYIKSFKALVFKKLHVIFVQNICYFPFSFSDIVIFRIKVNGYASINLEEGQGRILFLERNNHKDLQTVDPSPVRMEAKMKSAELLPLKVCPFTKTSFYTKRRIIIQSVTVCSFCFLLQLFKFV